MQQEQLQFAPVAAVALVPDVLVVATPALNTLGEASLLPIFKNLKINQNYCHVSLHIFSFR